MHAKTRSKTAELLDLLLWTAESLHRPTWRNITESYEGWSYRNGLLSQLRRLERQQWLECQPGSAGERLYRLTKAGSLQALGGRDPRACWARRWDGLWRLILFDVPESKSSARNKLRGYLRACGFGYLQNSVWITPHPLIEQRALLADSPVDVESLILLEARPCAGESDAQIVAGAWDFAQINRCYAKHQEILGRRPRGLLNNKTAAKAFHRWHREERDAWMESLRRDPLLPGSLLPGGYVGCQAWEARRVAMQEIKEQIRTFKVE